MSDNILVLKAVYHLANENHWGGWSWGGTRSTSRTFGDLTIELVDSQTDDSREGDGYYGEYSQGSTAPAYLLFKVTDKFGAVAFVRKSGEFDSYGHLSWHGPITEVKPIEKTVTVYELA